MLDYIHGSGDNSHLHGYLIHSLWLKDSNYTTSTFWQLQGSIMTHLRTFRDLQVVVAIILPDHDNRCVKTFIKTLSSNGWVLSKHNVSFLYQGDSIAGSCLCITGVHSSCASMVEPLLLKAAPPTPPRPLGISLWEQFNRPDHSVSLAKDDDDFCHQDVKFTASLPKISEGSQNGIIVKYFLHLPGSDETCLTGASVVLCEGLCPPFDACPNTNIFQHLFGIIFSYKNHQHVQGILSFKFAHCFGFTDDLTYRLSHAKNKFCLDGALPGRTSCWIFDQIHAHLVFLRYSNCELFSPKQYAAPATIIQAFVNGAIGSRLPSHSCWVHTYSKDSECSTL